MNTAPQKGTQAAQPTSRLDAQMAFLHEADKLKSITRATLITDGARAETSAEHSWHVALMALTLAEHAPAGVNATRVIQMLLLHDLVEIDAGDAPIFGSYDAQALAQAEQAAADRLFGLLPQDQAKTFRALWDEFEANTTPDARFAKSLDRFSAPNQNLISGGGSWVAYQVTYDQLVTKVGQKINAGAPTLWSWLAPKAKAFLQTLRRSD